MAQTPDNSPVPHPDDDPGSGAPARSGLRREAWLAQHPRPASEPPAADDAARVLLDASRLFQTFVTKISDGDPWGDAEEIVLAERSADTFDAAVLALAGTMIRELDFKARVGHPVHVGPGGRGAMQVSDEDTSRLRLVVPNPRRA